MTCADASACAALLWPALDAAGAAAAAEPSTGDAPITAAEIARALSHGALAARPAALGGPNSAPPPPPRLPASGSHKRRVSDHGAGSDSNGNRPAKVGIRGAPKKADSAAAGSTVAWQSAEFQPVVVARSAARSRQCEGEAAVAARRHAGRLVAFLEDTGVLTPGEATAARAANSEAAAALFQLAETAGGDCASGAIAGSSFAAVSGFAALAAVPQELHPLHHSQMQAAGFDLKFVARMVEGVCSPKLDAKYISRWRKDDKGAANRTAVCLLLKVALHLALRERVAERRAELCEHVGELLRRCDSGASAPPLATSPPAACSSNKSGGCASTDALCADGLTFAHALSTDLTAPPSSVALPIAGSAVAAANTAAMAAASAARSVAPNPSYRVDSSLPRSGSSTTAAAAAASARSALMPVPAATESAATAAVARGGFPASLAVSATVSLTHRYLCDFGACLSASERRLCDSVVAHTGAMREWMASRGLNFAAWMGIDLPASLRCHEFSSDPTLEGDQRRLLDGLVSDIRAAARAAAPNAGAAARLAAASDMPAALRKNRSMPWEQKVVRHVFAKSAVQLEASRPPLLGGKLADGVAMAGTLKRTLGLRELPASLSSAFAGYDALVSRAEGRRRFRLYLQSARRGAAQNGITMGCRSACCMAIDGENGSACVDYVLDAAYPFLVRKWSRVCQPAVR